MAMTKSVDSERCRQSRLNLPNKHRHWGSFRSLVEIDRVNVTESNG